MKNQLFSLLMLIVLAVGLAVPGSAVSAEGAEHVYAVAYSESLCFVPEGTPLHPDCKFVDSVTLPNGRKQYTGFADVMKFTSSDPRWNATCIFSADPFTVSDKSYPIMGSFVCTPTDPNMHGQWIGSLTQVFPPDGYIARFTAKGYGDFEGLQTISRNSMSAHPYEEIEIIELPGYQH